MSSGGKSSSAQKSLNYYGTIAGVVCWRLDWLTAIVANGNYIWQCSGGGPLDLTAPGALTADGYVDLTGGLLDPTLIMEGGYFRLYPGVSYANPDPALPGHPGHRDCAVIVANHIFFGQNSGTAPNIQVIGGCKPQVPTTIVAAIDNVVDDRQVNPVAALAEFLLDERGGSMLEAQLDAASWLSSSHWCAQDQAHKDYSFVSPLVTDQTATRDVVKKLLDPINGFLRWTKDGKLGCFLYEWGVDPGGLVTLDARHWTRKPRFTDGDWQAIPTEYVVSFTDRAYEFQENTVRVPNQRAAQIRGTDDPAKLDRQNVTRSPQAHAQGVEYKRRAGSAPGTGTIFARAPIVAGLQPGDKIKVDTDPEPGGAGLAQLARVDKIEFDRTDEVTIDLTLDPLVPATAYTPTWVSPLPESLFAGAVEVAPSLAHMLAIPLPFDFSGWPPAVGFVATRPSPSIIGFHAYFTDNPATAFAELGLQGGFAARCQLVNAVASGAGVLRLQLLDGATGPDAYIAADTPGGNVAKANDDALLAILVSLDGSGRVALDGAGQPIMEFASILDRSAVTADTHDYTVFRGRAGTTARAWGAAAVAWIISNAALVPWTHAQFDTMFGATAYFRLAAFTSAAVDETMPLPETDMIWPSIPTPDNLVATNGTGKAVSLNWAGSSIFSDSGEYAVYRATGPGYVDWAKIGEIRATRFSDHEVTLGTTYQYKIAAVTENEEVSAYSNTVTITVAKVVAGDVDQTLPNDPGAPTLVDSGAYVAGDGTVHSYLMIRVQPLPTAGGGKVAGTSQVVQYRIHGTGASAWTIQDEPQNAGATDDVRIDDLPPGSSIDVQVIAYSQFDQPSGAVAATGSPFTAPQKTALPNAPTAVTYVAGDSGSYNRPPYFLGNTLLPSARVNWTAPADRDVVGYEWIITTVDTDAAANAAYPTGSAPSKDTEAIVADPLFSVEYFRVRSIDSSGNKSAWAGGGTSLHTVCRYPAGNLSEQNSNAVAVSAVQIGAAGASSIEQVVARAPFDTGVVPTLAGGLAEESINVSIANKGFTIKPDGTTGSINVSSNPALKGRYDWDDPSNSSTNAVLKVSTVAAGGTTPAGPVRLTGEFYELF